MFQDAVCSKGTVAIISSVRVDQDNYLTRIYKIDITSLEEMSREWSIKSFLSTIVIFNGKLEADLIR